MTGILVTGTDTGVGKTVVACGLLAGMRSHGVRVAAMKPVETGWAGEWWPDDAAALREAAGRDHPMQTIVPYAFRDPLAPLVAAERAGAAIDPLVLAEGYSLLESTSDVVVVEGAGGIAVTITRELDYAQLASAWGLRVVVVCRPGLGTLNHTMLTVRHAERAGAKVLGLVVNRMPTERGLAETTNLDWLPRLTGLPVLGVVGEALPPAPRSTLPLLGAQRPAAGPSPEHVARQLDIERILSLLKIAPKKGF